MNGDIVVILLKAFRFKNYMQDNYL